ncbi:MAG TPA: DNA polymerase domain-containing protein [Nitrososphaeraceae archaeon]|nr:DNA polymerase domain-containing protein [Nitrososphaeraceae archaeon]
MVSNCIGWLFHVSIEQDKAILWIKTEDKKVLRLTDSYQPFFYILPRNEYDGTSLFHILSQQPIVKKVKWEENNSTNLFEEYSQRKLICVTSESVQSYTVLQKKLEIDARVKQVFNTDLSHVQQYLFHKLKIEPTSKVEVEYDDSRLVRLTKVEDEDDIFTPPFSLLHVNVQTSSGRINPEDPVSLIKSRYDDMCEPKHNLEILFDNNQEKDILEDFCSVVQDKDPDIIVFEGDHYANTILDYLFARIVKIGLELSPGREKRKMALLASLKHPGLHWIKGRLAISSKTINRYSSILDRFGFAGLIELCRFGFLPIDLAAKYGINRLIDSRNCYELIQRGYVISKKGNSGNHEHIRTMEELVSNDRGGMIISPQTGLHENVVVLDYDNEYANFIVNHNLSYETVIPDKKTKRDGANKGLLPTVVEKFLQRRLYFEAISNGLQRESKEYLWCQQRLDSLKNILVCLYGTTGSIWNRYGNVRVFEEINRLSREILIETKDVVQKLGWELIYADTDSIFIKNPDGVAPTNQNENIVSILRRETGLPISVEHNLKFLVLLPLEANEKIEALKQYYGVTHERCLVVRGVEIRRHDTPKFIKDFQIGLLYALFDCNDVKEIINKGYENALLLVTKAIDKIMIGGDDIIQDDLIIHKMLGQDIIKYKSLFPHVSAAIQLSNNEDKLPSKGDTIKYIYTNSQHKNPLCRVTSIDSTNGVNGKLDYDKEKYKEMILDAAETVLGYFGFDRISYGNKKTISKRKWWWMEELRKERERDIRTEMMDHK